MELEKTYEPQRFEPRWAEWWVESGIFHADPHAPGPRFSLVVPPPNVTGSLHIGHMLDHTVIDTATRWHRMRGDNTLFLPGTDHAGIATQMLVERSLAAEGIARRQIGRQEFVRRVWEWKEKYGNRITSQMKRIGDSCDWSRERFTLNPDLSRAVLEAFVRLYERGLIYRGTYMVNWCPRCATALSDLEVKHDDTQGNLWHIRYPVNNSSRYLIVATTRPETMLGDTAVAVNPSDPRYQDLAGQTVTLPLMNRPIPVIFDEIADPQFGTGVVKVTPAHDPNDLEAGKRHDLPQIKVIGEDAHMTAEAGPYAGLDRFEARKRIVADLEKLGLLEKVEPYALALSKCDRCSAIVEPLISTQWFVKTKPLADKAMAAVNEGRIQFIPDNWNKTFFNWMDNIRDWCISRQLWWGHRIPAWHCGECHKITVPQPGSTGDPAACAHCGSETITQETDVLDTWFSSGLLPVSVFGWPNLTPETRADFDAFYPTSLLVTGFDILFFWVARMIMLGCWFSSDVPMPDGSPRPLAETVPFREVYIHALVRDANREKMSKTKGNVIDPIEIVKQYGTDAVRFTLASMASPGTDIAFNVARTEGYRAFANKIWNAARFIFMNVDRAAEVGITVDPSALGSMPTVAANAPLEARWIVAELHATAAKVNESLENYRYDEAASIIYQFFWGSFCDWYLEIVKLRLDFEGSRVVNGTKGEILSEVKGTRASLTTLVQVFECALRLLSPFMPFITEELWHALSDGNPPAKSIALAVFPNPCETSDSSALVIEEMTFLQSLITEIRGLRKEIGVEEKAIVPIEVRTDAASRKIAEENSDIIERLTRVSEVRFVEHIAVGLSKHSTPQFDVAVIYERTIDVAAERERLTKDIAKLEKIIESSDRQLDNRGFLAKAPAHIVEGLRKQRGEAKRLFDKARGDLDGLPGG